MFMRTRLAIWNREMWPRTVKWLTGMLSEDCEVAAPGDQQECEAAQGDLAQECEVAPGDQQECEAAQGGMVNDPECVSKVIRDEYS